MAFKVNYGLERAERNRAKLAKKEAKSLARKEHDKDADGAESSGNISDPSHSSAEIADKK